MLPAGNAVRLDRASLAGAWAYAAWAPSTNAAIAAAGIHRVMKPPLHAGPKAVPFHYDTVNGTFRVIV